jgi:hypothetical protein
MDRSDTSLQVDGPLVYFTLFKSPIEEEEWNGNSANPEEGGLKAAHGWICVPCAKYHYYFHFVFGSQKILHESFELPFQNLPEQLGVLNIY